MKSEKEQKVSREKKKNQEREFSQSHWVNVNLFSIFYV